MSYELSKIRNIALLGHGGNGILDFLHDGDFLFHFCYICGFFDNHRLNFFTHTLNTIRLNINPQI